VIGTIVAVMLYAIVVPALSGKWNWREQISKGGIIWLNGRTQSSSDIID